MLSPRADVILKTIIGRYIEHAVPVPSQSLVHEGMLDVSSATVRNEMVRLERDGYIVRPYSSAGSIPTDKGYRYYVESLTAFNLPLEEQQLISHLFHQVERRLDEWLTLTAALIARLVQNVAIVTEPKPAGCKYKHMELVALQDSLALVVLVLHGARVKQRLLFFDKPVAQSELGNIADRMNSIYAGLNGTEIADRNKGLNLLEQQVTDCLVEMIGTEDRRDYSEPYFDGLHFMLNQPEFINNPRVAAMVELVENRSVLKIVLPSGLGSMGVRVVIGKENQVAVAQDYSLVIGRYGLPEEVVGTIGVIGPTRMPYARAISTVSYLSRVLSQLMAELYGSEVKN